MAKMITFDEKAVRFHLHNGCVSYVLDAARGKYLLHRYWGHGLREYRDCNYLQYIDRGFSPQPADMENERTFSLDVLPQEYPCAQHGDFRIPAYEAELANGTRVTELVYHGWRVYPGKNPLSGLPASYAEAEEAETLEIELQDTADAMTVFLSYTIFAGKPVIARSARFVNSGKKSLCLRQAHSMAVDFSDHDFDMLSLHGGHAAERMVERMPLQAGIREIASSRGGSSHQHSPFMALARKGTSEQQGQVYGFSFVYSGSFSLRTEVEQFGSLRVVMGLNPAVFSWKLEPGEEFQTPEVIMVYSEGGISGMSQTFHAFWRQHLLRGKYREALRPILVNNWEATYFDFDEKKILQLADSARDLGIELLVLDDGWFGKRNDDNTSLGDWFVNEEKLSQGMKSLTEKVQQRGLKFGLWFEPEMVSVDSCLYREHPDWILQVPDYKTSFSRHQLVLDLTRQEVRDYIVAAVHKILSEAPIDYVKWDMNRHLTEAFSTALPEDRQLETQHRYILGLYEILERITSAFPDILFESCSGGGGRFDAGMLYYMPQTWTSDNTDAVCRLAIQAGTSMVFPPLTMGAHISVTPNHQMGRVTPMQMRALVAMAGDFGYEMDITSFTETEKHEAVAYIELYKELRPTLQLGKFIRLMLDDSCQDNEFAWMFISQDTQEVVVMYFKVLATPAAPLRSLHLTGLQENTHYRVARYLSPQSKSYGDGGKEKTAIVGQVFYGDELMYGGLAVEKVDADFASYMWVLRKDNR